MAGLKRKESPSSKHQQASPTKKTKKRPAPMQKHLIDFEKETETDSEPIVASDTNSESGEDDGVSWPEDDEPDEFEGIEEEEQSTEKSNGRKTDAPEGYAEVVERSKQKPVVPCKAPVSPHTLYANSNDNVVFSSFKFPRVPHQTKSPRPRTQSHQT